MNSLEIAKNIKSILSSVRFPSSRPWVKDVCARSSLRRRQVRKWGKQLKGQGRSQVRVWALSSGQVPQRSAGVSHTSHLSPSKGRKTSFQCLTSVCHWLQAALGGHKFPGASGLKEHELNSLHKPKTVILKNKAWVLTFQSKGSTQHGKGGIQAELQHYLLWFLIHSWITFQK